MIPSTGKAFIYIAAETESAVITEPLGEEGEIL